MEGESSVPKEVQPAKGGDAPCDAQSPMVSVQSTRTLATKRRGQIARQGRETGCIPEYDLDAPRKQDHANVEWRISNAECALLRARLPQLSRLVPPSHLRKNRVCEKQRSGSLRC